MSTIVIMPGGFHPFHAGHAALYNSARKAFPNADVYVAATDDTSTRPFPFQVKEKLAQLAGVDKGRFMRVKSPFQAKEITAPYNPAKDRLIFVRSEKDADKPPQAGGVKKDGSPSYLQPLAGQTNIRPFGEHAYMAYLPTVEFGPGMTSATEIRTAWPTLNEKRKTALVMSLYPATQKNPALAANVVKMLDAAIGSDLTESNMLGHVMFRSKPPKLKKIQPAASRTKDFMKRDFSLSEDELNEFAPDEGGESRKFIPWNEFVDQLKQILHKDFDCKESINMDVIKAKFVPYDPMEFGPTQIYSYFERRAGRKGANSVRGQIQVGKFSKGQSGLITGYHLLKGTEFERYFDLTFDNLYKIANIIKGNTEGRLQMQPINEFAPGGGDDGNGPDEYEILHRLAAMWWLGTEQQMIKAQRTLAAMGWEIGEDEGYDDGGVFVVRADDEHGKSYISWPHEDLQLDENQGWAATFTNEETGQMAGTPASTGMWAGYQRRENQPIDEDYVEEKWSQKYKNSINCANPKGFSQRAHCAGRKK